MYSIVQESCKSISRKKHPDNLNPCKLKLFYVHGQNYCQKGTKRSFGILFVFGSSIYSINKKNSLQFHIVQQIVYKQHKFFK